MDHNVDWLNVYVVKIDLLRKKNGFSLSSFAWKDFKSTQIEFTSHLIVLQSADGLWPFGTSYGRRLDFKFSCVKLPLQGQAPPD